MNAQNTDRNSINNRTPLASLDHNHSQTMSPSSLQENEGDQLANAVQNQNAVIQPVGRNESAPGQSNRNGISFTDVPRVDRGSMIDGESGPLQSVSTPGAFSAPGRTFGELPTWASNNYNRQDNTTVASFQGYHINDIEVATAALVEHEPEHCPTSSPIEQEVDGTSSMERHPRQPLTIQVVPACEVVNESFLEQKNLKFVAIVMCFVVGFLTIVLVVLIVIFVNKDDSSQATPAQPEQMLFPRETTLPSLEEICTSFYHPSTSLQSPPTDNNTALVQKINTSPIVECYCVGEISIIPDDVARLYSEFLNVLIDGEVLTESPIQTNCTDPTNLALLWFAESKAAPSKTSLHRFVLELCFIHSMVSLGRIGTYGYPVQTHVITTVLYAMKIL